MKTRLLGAAVLLALLVLFVPMFFSSKPPAPGGDQTVSLAIPPAPDRDLQTKTMSLSPDAAAAASAPAAVTPGPAGNLATVNIGTNRPGDAQGAAAAAAPTVTTGSGASASQPVIPMQNKPAAAPAGRPAATVAVASKAAKIAAVAPTTGAAAQPAAVGGQGSYLINLSAYASAAGAASLQQSVRALGYPVSSHVTTQAGKSRTLVIAGPFETRTAAEAARLKITQSVPGVPAHIQQDAGPQAATASAAAPAAVKTSVAAPAAAAPARAGGYAVQVAAMSSQGDATALRDKLRANGFDGFVDSVQSGGKQLWRVRAGPQTQRADAQRLHDQIKAKLGIDGNIVSVP